MALVAGTLETDGLPAVTKARGLVAGAAWTYGGTLISALAQLVYAAITSRLVGATGYGTYTVALFVFGLISLLASGGLGQTIGRAPTVDTAEIKSLFSYAILLGVTSSVFVFVTASFWGQLWGNASAEGPIRWLSASAAVAPSVGLATGLLRRLGKFRLLAVVTLLANLAGMVAGAVLVYEYRSASSLLASAIVAQFLLLGACIVSSDGHLRGLASLKAGGKHLGFSWKLTGTSILSYLTGAISRWGVSRWLGAADLGVWNRAEVLTTVPFQQIQNSIVQVVYPEFRNDVGNPDRARRVWPDLLTMVAWLALPFSATVAVIAPTFVPFILGPDWHDVSSIIPPLAIAGGLQILSTLLSSAIEAIAKFSWVVSTQLILILVQVLGVILAVYWGDFRIAIYTLIVTNIVRHGWQLVLCHRSGYVDVASVLVEYGKVIAGCLLAAGFSLFLLILWRTSFVAPWFGVPVLSAVVIAAYLLWQFSSYLPPIQLMRKYGILRR